MNPEDLWWETLVPKRQPFARRVFLSWSRALQNANWWKSGDCYISNYGCKNLVTNPQKKGYDRDEVPDYDTAQVRFIYADLDYRSDRKPNGFTEYDLQQSVARLGAWCDSNERGRIKRRWNFTGGGVHGFLAASGPIGKIADAHETIVKESGAKFDQGCYQIASMHRVIGSRNTRKRCYVIPVSEEEIITMSQEELIQLAQEKRRFDNVVGEESWYFVDVEAVYAESTGASLLGSYNKEVVDMDFTTALDEYGLDWDADFCPALKYLCMKDNISNPERLQVIKYLMTVLKVPFVDVDDENKTVASLFHALLKDKQKANHAIKAKEVETIYKKPWKYKFHPQKTRKWGICPTDCAECLERREQ